MKIHKKQFTLIIYAFVFTTSLLSAQGTNLDMCTQETLLQYFPEPIVNEVLKGYQVPDQLWPQINQELQAQDLGVIKAVEEKASRISPNPLEGGTQKNAAISIFRETLYEAFAKVMNNYGINEDEQIRAMLDEIQYKKGKLFKQCMDKQSDTLQIQPAEAEEIEVQEQS